MWQGLCSDLTLLCFGHPNVAGVRKPSIHVVAHVTWGFCCYQFRARHPWCFRTWHLGDMAMDAGTSGWRSSFFFLSFFCFFVDRTPCHWCSCTLDL